MAALCPLQLSIQYRNPVRAPVQIDQELLVTDGPTLFMPGTVSIDEMGDVAAFELYSRGSSLGLLSTSPAPVANFTSEGGFQTPDDYAWSATAEEELSDRLNRLMDLPID
jgi:hypothetical protein